MLSKHIRTTTAICFALLGALLSGGCREQTSAPLASPDLLEMGAGTVIYNMVNYLSASGIREGRVQADTAYVYPDSSMIYLRGTSLILYTETGEIRARVTAQRGRLNNITKELTAEGNVVLTITEGNRKVETAELHYAPDGNEIWSDSATVMTEGGSVLRGQAFRSDLQFRNARVINGSVTGGGGVRF